MRNKILLSTDTMVWYWLDIIFDMAKKMHNKHSFSAVIFMELDVFGNRTTDKGSKTRKIAHLSQSPLPISAIPSSVGK